MKCCSKVIVGEPLPSEDLHLTAGLLGLLGYEFILHLYAHQILARVVLDRIAQFLDF
jgi:hypothetical protein